MGIQLNDGPSAFVFMSVEVEVAHPVFLEGSQAIAFFSDDGKHFIFESADAVGIADALYALNEVLRIHGLCPLGWKEFYIKTRQKHHKRPDDVQ